MSEEEATAQDWEDFWYAPEKFGTWHPEDTKDGDDIVVNMDGGVGGSWQVKPETQTSLLKKKAEHFAGNYQGPLYARHPDLVKKDKELDKATQTYIDSVLDGGVVCKRESPLSD